MKRKAAKKKYADGGLVVSRGGRDTSGLRLGLGDADISLNTPTAMGAADAMAANDAATSSGPSIEELQARNLAAVRAKEARDTAKRVVRRATAAESPKPRAAKKAAEDDWWNDDNPPRKTAPKQPAAKPEPRVGLQNARGIVSLAARAASALEEINRPRASASDVIRAKAAQRLAQVKPVTGSPAVGLQNARAAADRMERAALGLKKGGHVKMSEARGKSNMSAMAKALKGK